MKPRILIFCKAPLQGEVMTRLIDALGGDSATKLHQALASDMIERCLDASITEIADVELWCTPPTEHEFYKQFNLIRRLQKGQDLGQRMSDAFSSTGSAAILIGTDCPNLDVEYLQAAIAKLADHHAVIGPAEDGGYGLIGLQQANEELFRNIGWGGSRVCAETCRKMNMQGLNFALLPLLWDVDRPEDVKRYRSVKREDLS